MLKQGQEAQLLKTKDIDCAKSFANAKIERLTTVRCHVRILPSLGPQDAAHQRPFDEWARSRFSPNEEGPGGLASARVVSIARSPGYSQLKKA